MPPSSPTRNRVVLDELVANGGIAIEASPLFRQAPHPLEVRRDRIEGMLLGLAIGDALGNSSEGLSPGERRTHYGEIRDYLPNRYAGSRAVGLPSDDTQLAFWTLEQILSDGRVDPENIARRFSRGQIFGIGNTVATFLKHLEAGQPWFKAGQPSAGNGALMRIAPVVVPHLKTQTSELWVDTALTAMITHNDAASISACAAFIGIVWDLLAMDRPPEQKWWVARYVEIARPLEFEEPYEVIHGEHRGWTGRLSRLVEEVVPQAARRNLSVLEACESWGSGAFLLETVPSVLYILSRHGDSFEEAVTRAVNDTLDNDTTGAIVGAAMGALHGKSGIPERWVQGLLGRTTASDDGRIFDLIDRAYDEFLA